MINSKFRRLLVMVELCALLTILQLVLLCLGVTKEACSLFRTQQQLLRY